MRRITPHELLDRARQYGTAAAQQLPLTRRVADARRRRCVQPDLSAERALAEVARHIPIPTEIQLRQLLKQQPGNAEQSILEKAEDVLRGRHVFLGLGELEFGNPPDWHLEPTSGIRSPLVHWMRLDNHDESKTGNRKVVWELNRHQYLPVLGLAYTLTDDDRYSAAIASHLDDWIRRNPTSMGINWSSSLEVAFRLISWLWSLAFLAKKPAWDRLAHSSIAEALTAHGQHISTFLSTYFSPNTHLTGEALGLYYLGTCIPGLRLANRWRAIGRNILAQQLEKQIRSDGTYFEQATWYQRYTADFYIHFRTLAERSGDSIPETLNTLLEKQLEVLLWITRPDGSSPYIGDDDGGRLMSIDERPPADWRATLSTGAAIYQRGDFKHVAGPPALETLLLRGQSALDQYASIDARPPSGRARGFSHGGFYSMRRNWDSSSHCLLMNCGPHGVMNCGHAHADALGFDLSVSGKPMIVDPGTYTYSQSDAWRNRFRSAAMHNTVTVQDVASSIPAENSFQWNKVTDAHAECWHGDEDVLFFSGRHAGFSDLREGGSHIRSIAFLQNQYWIIVDSLPKLAGLSASAHFNFSSDCVVRHDVTDNSLVVIQEGVRTRIQCSHVSGCWTLTSGAISECFAQKTRSKRAIFNWTISDTEKIVWAIVPDEATLRTNSVSDKSAPAPDAIEIVGHDYCDSIFVTADRNEDAIGDFELAWRRRYTDDRSPGKIIAVHGQKLTTTNLDLEADDLIQQIVVEESDGLVDIRVDASTSLRVTLNTEGTKLAINGNVVAAHMGRQAEFVVDTSCSSAADGWFCRKGISR